MTKITVTEDCGNAPKKQYVKDFNIAYAQANLEKVVDMLADDAEFNLVGGAVYKGKENIKKALENMGMQKAKELVIDNILSHGNRCAANGTLVYNDQKVHFSDIYIFSSHSGNAKIKSLVSYGIEVAI